METGVLGPAGELAVSLVDLVARSDQELAPILPLPMEEQLAVVQH